MTEKKTRILLIDDQPRWIRFVQKDLDQFEIVIASNHQEALARLKDDGFDLVIANSRRLDVLEIIAKQYADKAVVVTTIEPTVQEQLAAYRLGAKGYWAKSWRRRNLLEKVQEVVSVSS